MDYSARKFSVRRRTGKVVVVSISVYVIKVWSVTAVVYRLHVQKYVVREWGILNLLPLYLISGISKASHQEWAFCWICLRVPWKRSFISHLMQSSNRDQPV